MAISKPPKTAIKPVSGFSSLPLPGIPAKRGRPATGKAKTPAQRQRAYRLRQKSISVTRYEKSEVGQ